MKKEVRHTLKPFRTSANSYVSVMLIISSPESLASSQRDTKLK